MYPTVGLVAEVRVLKWTSLVTWRHESYPLVVWWA